MYRINITDQSLHFSSGHMTIYGDGAKETIHGHTFVVKVSIGLDDSSPDEVIPFEYFKNSIVKVCKEWNEKLLLPAKSSFLKIISKTEDEIELYLCKKHYVLPTDEVVFLETGNISVEALASTFCHRFVSHLDQDLVKRRVFDVEVTIEEIPGYSVTFVWRPRTIKN